MNYQDKFAHVSHRIIYFLIAVLFSVFSLSAQDFENFRPTQCQGAVPNDFKNYATEKFRTEEQEINKSGNKSKQQKKLEKDFSLKSNFEINDLLFSGRVLFGDPMTQYVNDVAAIVLNDHPDLQKTIRFYIIKSDVVNAFATQQKIVFINSGLLAQLNNEAELAFVLCHEIGHIVKNHVLEGYLKKESCDWKFYEIISKIFSTINLQSTSLQCLQS